MIIRLLDFKEQEIYYEIIVERYTQYCARLRPDDSLVDALAALSLEKEEVKLDDISSRTSSQDVRELSTITMAMRKIREAIVASSRTDSFAQKAYMFIIKAAILTKHMESYHAALLHLLSKIHPTSPLSKLEYHEFVGYHILDLACRRNDLAQAYHVQNRVGYRDPRVDMILRAIVHANWHQFWNAYKSADGYQRSLMEWHINDMRKHVVKCIGRCYLMVTKSYVETAAASSWEHLQKENSLGWDVNGEVLTIRRPKII